MKKVFIIANWKSNKTEPEAKEWLQTLNDLQFAINKEEKEIIICPPFTLLSFVKQSIVKSQLLLVVGAQNISQFDEGAYTGEVNGKQIKQFADMVLIGHSERRSNFDEDDKILEEKVKMAKKYNMTPVYCVQNKDDKVPSGVSIVAYEPVSAIGTGNPDTPERADQVAKYVKDHAQVAVVLYGGSVTKNNVMEFTRMSNIDGVLVGGASLNAKEFYEIIQNA